MQNFTYTITDPSGIHARPAGILVKAVAKFNSKISLEKAGKTADAKKIFSVMGLAVKTGEKVEVSIEGEDEEAACAELKKFFEENL